LSEIKNNSIRGNVRSSGGQNDNLNSMGPTTITSTYYARSSASSGALLYNSRRGRNVSLARDFVILTPKAQDRLRGGEMRPFRCGWSFFLLTLRGPMVSPRRRRRCRSRPAPAPCKPLPPLNTTSKPLEKRQSISMTDPAFNIGPGSIRQAANFITNSAIAA
jgi:hypothetical protein